MVTEASTLTATETRGDVTAIDPEPKAPTEPNPTTHQTVEQHSIVQSHLKGPPEPREVPSSPKFTEVAVYSAVGLAFVGILGALLLTLWLVRAGIHSSDVVLVRVLLSCVAVFVASGFVAIGFALFLVKADGAFKAKVARGTESGTLETTAPGLAVIVCAVVVMYFALHMNISTAAAGGSPNGGVVAPHSLVDAKGFDSTPLGGVMEKPQ